MDEYRLALICGNIEETDKLKDGMTIKLGKLGIEDLHGAILLDFAEQHYPNIPWLERYRNSYHAEVIAYFYTLMGYIVFFNTTKENKKYGNNGLFMMPRKITPKQEASLQKLASELNGYDVDLVYHLHVADGLVDGEVISKSKNLKTPSQLVSHYLSNFVQKEEENCKKL